ncbi:beta-N-acetylhexosaminidase [Pedobacter nyackensis]|uniref:beta-N-acetylhexosaminidase n=1 Tax=Pedobacter nyackensis TaxID=475255 RepID=UPI00292F98C8|nr:family 20 glycosylhydrolase [Pedobacter nyackensis]
MKKVLSVILLAFLYVNTFAQDDVNMGIIPAPVSVKKNPGSFKLDKTVVLVSKDAKNAKSADLLNAFVVTRGGFSLREAKSAGANERAIILSSEGADQLPAEGYTIKITAKNITVTGKDAGLFYGVQSLIQTMPEKKGNQILINAAEISDYPRFKYRGMHLDVARHIFPVSFVKKYIDLMSQYKLNNFHWHLTDDQGWRIEIKKYPKLTTAGASRNGTIIGHHPGVNNDGEVYKGFYTQNEVKEVVAYAASRFINVIPEIEMPGHASAAITAYPELSCFPERDTFVDKNTPWAGSRKGKQVQQTWGVFDDVFVPSDNTFKFLQDVLDEVIALFPSKYIHIGGDESPKEYWKESEFCQKLIKQLGLKDEHELQSYFIQRMEKYVNSKGRSIIGWDEILEGGLAPNATVMSWRGTEGGIAAAKQNHDVIMSPGGPVGLYFDHKQSKSADEPTNIGGLAPYSLAYSYDPMPKELSADQQKYIIGVQANVWTEYMRTPSKVEYFILPRLFALSEIAWTQNSRKDIKNFSEERLPQHLLKLDKTNTNYWVPTPFGQDNPVQKGDQFEITLKEPIPGSKIYYTFDLTRPSELGTLYTKPIKINVAKGAKQVLKTVVITPSGKRSVVTETVLNNGAADVKTK